ncbi:ParA family protein [Streptomyces sp. MMS24-I29]|uniref:ParA family protein n=1 Tax=Streptomyces sp. MMS24-I29 TaxID=3351480 RepID=UPI003C7D61AC
MRTTSLTVDPRFRPKRRTWPLICAYTIECGGSTKSTSATSMAVTAALRGHPGVLFDLDSNMPSTTVLGYDETAPKDKPTAVDLLYDRATLDEVALPARYRAGDGYDDEDIVHIPNLRVVPSSPAMADADTAIARDPDRNDWFVEILRSYEGDDTVFYLDFPASYGMMPYSVLRMMDEDDSVIPSVPLPCIRYSADAKKLYGDECPPPILLRNSVPSVDYRKVMTHLGFVNLV